MKNVPKTFVCTSRDLSEANAVPLVDCREKAAFFFVSSSPWSQKLKLDRLEMHKQTYVSKIFDSQLS